MQVLEGYPEVMTAQEVADVVRVTKRQVVRLARERELAAFKWGKEWRFLRSEIHAHMTNTPANAAPLLAQLPEVMTTAEVAAVTRSTVRQVRELADSGSLPAFRVGGEWRFLRQHIAGRLEMGRKPQD
ncbi:helix-turn-helix domain-containing protein [Streptomyces kronopolitis]